MNKRHYEHTLPNIRGSLSNTYVELLNMGINTLTINDIHSQQNLNKPKEKLRDHRHPFVNFSFGEWFVEKMLRGYEAVYKYITLTIHQINKFSSTSKPYVI